MPSSRFQRRSAAVRVIAAFSVAAAMMSVSGCSGISSSDATELPSTVKIGATLPLTGPGAAYGARMREGLELGIDQINSHGGIRGSKVELIAMDTQGQPGPTVSATRELTGEGVMAIATAFTAPPLAQLDLAERAGVPLFNGGGYDPKLLGHEWLYNDLFMLNQEAEAGLRYAHDTLGAKSLGLIFETNLTPEANDVLGGVWKSISGQAATSVSIDQAATDVSPQLTKILAAKPEALFVAADGTVAQLVYKQLAALNVHIPVVNSSAALALDGVLDSSLADQLVFTQQVLSPNPEFQKVYDEKYPGQPVNSYVANYYNMPLILKSSLEYALDQKLPINGRGVQKALTDLNKFDGCCGTVTFNDKHGLVGNLDILRVVDGKTKTVDTVTAPIG